MSFTILDEDLKSYIPKKDYIRKGISIPFEINESGKISLSTGKELDEQGILINLLDTNNDNAFLQIESYESYIFKQNNGDIQSAITDKLVKIFNMFEDQHRMKLILNSVQVQQVDEFVYVSFDYYNYETDQINNIAIQGKI